MGKLVSSITEAAYRPGLAPTYELSILLGVDSSSYMLLDNQRRPIVVEQWEHPGQLAVAAWTNMVAKSELLIQQYRKVKVAWAGIRQLLVPARLYRAEEKRSYLEHLTKTPAIENIEADFLPDFSVWNVYAMDSACQAAILRNYPHAKFFHIHTALLPLFQAGHGAERVYAHYDGAVVRLFAFKEDRMVYANAFVCPHARDFLYYTLLVYDQQQFRPAQTPLYLLGHLVRDSEIYRLLYRYLANINFQPSPIGFIPGEKLATYPAHLYVDLMALQLCE